VDHADSAPRFAVAYRCGNAAVEEGTLEEEACCITNPFTAETLLEGVSKMLGLSLYGTARSGILTEKMVVGDINQGGNYRYPKND